MLIVLIEVRMKNLDFGKWLFYIGSGVFALAMFWLHLSRAKNIGTASVIALTLVLFTILMGIVIGVNVKFWLGGAL